MKRNLVAWVALAVSTAALIGSRGLYRPAPAAPQELQIPAEGQRHAQALSMAFEAVADFVRPSVVQISVQKGAQRDANGPAGRQRLPRDMDPKEFEDMIRRFFPDFRFERPQFGFRGEAGTGSGFVYDDQGHILTNNHVVADATRIEVTFYDGEKATAKVIGTDPSSDVAVIRVDKTDYRPLPKGRSKDLRVGEWVMAVGSPFGLSQTVTAGIISATERTPMINEFDDFIQTDAAINPGNSGGPLVNMAGKVIGVNSAIATSTRANAGVGFAIPIDMAGKIADKLIKDGQINRARVGIRLDTLTPQLAKQIGVDPKTQGVLVAEVVGGSPAEKAGLRSGDVVVGFDGEPIKSVSGFRNTVSTSDIGKSYELKYLRNGAERSTQIVPAPMDEVRFAFERQQEGQRPDGAGAAQAEISGFGFRVQPLTPALREQFGYQDKEGVIVAGVDQNGPAAAAGMEEGDLITKVIRDKKPQPVTSVDDLQEAAKDSDEMAIYVEDVNKVLPGQFMTLTREKK
jgi:serine protease Do